MKEGFAVPASAALALDHNHDSREPDTQVSPTPSASTTTTQKKKGRPRATPPNLLSPLAKWVIEDRKNDVKGTAGLLGIDPDYLYALMKGTRRPSPTLVLKISHLSEGKLDANILYGLNSPTKKNL